MQLGGEALTHAFAEDKWKAYKGKKRLRVNDLHIGPNSIDCTLHPKLLVPQMQYGWEPVGDGRQKTKRVSVVDMREEGSIDWDESIMDDDGFVLDPGTFVLGAVQERFDCIDPLHLPISIAGPGPNAVALTYWKPDIDGRSTMGRVGLGVHVTAGYGDYGFDGAFTLEIYNNFPRPILLFPGMRIAQVYFTQVIQPGRYKGAYSKTDHYNGPRAPQTGKGRV